MLLYRNICNLLRSNLNRLKKSIFYENIVLKQNVNFNVKRNKSYRFQYRSSQRNINPWESKKHENKNTLLKQVYSDIA